MGDNREQPPKPLTLPGDFELVKPNQDDEVATISPESDINPDVQTLTSFETLDELISWLEKNKDRSFMYSPDANEEDTRIHRPYMFMLENIQRVKEQLLENEINELGLSSNLKDIPTFKYDYKGMGWQTFRYRVAKLIGQAVRKQKGIPQDA